MLPITGRNHIMLSGTIEQTPFVLRSHKYSGVFGFCLGCSLINLRTREIRMSNRTHFSLLDEIVKYPKGLFYGSVGIGIMHLIQVNVISLQPFETGVDTPCDVFLRSPAFASLAVLSNTTKFRGKDNLFTARTENLTHEGL